MVASTCSAFLQVHARPLYVRASAGKHLLCGTKVGAWRVRDRCREHTQTQSTTYSVVNEPGGVHAALTVIETPALALGSYTRRILAIAQILTRIDHAGAVSILDAGLAADGRPYVVTELHDGVTLAERVQDGAPVERQRAITILRGICAALIAAHEVGVVHGSLELNHVLLAEGDDCHVRLLDWGVERTINDEARRAGVDRAMDASWMAPEEMLGIVSPQTDAYALGAVAFQLLFGAIVSDRRPGWLDARVAALEPADPCSLETLVCELLAADPRARPKLSEVAERLATIAHALERPSVSTTRAPVAAILAESFPDPYSKARAPRWVVTCVALGSIAAIATMFVVAGAGERSSHAASAQSVLIRSATATDPVATGVTATGPVVTGAAATPADPIGPPVPALERLVIPAVNPHRDTVRAHRATPARRVVKDANITDPSDGVRTELLNEYQRIGHDLIELRKQHGAAINELWQRFDALHIHQALATTKTRAAAATTLGELRVKIDRNKAVQPSPACIHNPLAEGCR